MLSCPSRPCMNAADAQAEPGLPSHLVPRIHILLNYRCWFVMISLLVCHLSSTLGFPRKGSWFILLYIFGAQYKAWHIVGFL